MGKGFGWNDNVLRLQGDASGGKHDWEIHQTVVAVGTKLVLTVSTQLQTDAKRCKGVQVVAFRLSLLTFCLINKRLASCLYLSR